mmetsp:Transcript_30659/g.74045  ORF Transcript_30659/g.74045 Transcript_30659/m.74045 type:complete len:245 (+) Transcript_30659:1413-2147(+)
MAIAFNMSSLSWSTDPTFLDFSNNSFSCRMSFFVRSDQRECRAFSGSAFVAVSGFPPSDTASFWPHLSAQWMRLASFIGCSTTSSFNSADLQFAAACRSLSFASRSCCLSFASRSFSSAPDMVDEEATLFVFSTFLSKFDKEEPSYLAFFAAVWVASLRERFVAAFALLIGSLELSVVALPLFFMALTDALQVAFTCLILFLIASSFLPFTHIVCFSTEVTVFPSREVVTSSLVTGSGIMLLNR